MHALGTAARAPCSAVCVFALAKTLIIHPCRLCGVSISHTDSLACTAMWIKDFGSGTRHSTVTSTGSFRAVIIHDSDLFSLKLI